MPSALQASSAARRRRLDRVGDGDDAARLPSIADEQGGRAVAREARRPARQGRQATPWSAISLALPERHGAAADRAGHALAGDGGEVARLRATRSSLRSAAARRWRAASGCSLDRSRLAARPARRFGQASAGHDRGDARACLRSACRSCRRPACRPSPCRSSASADLISTPAPAPLPTPTMIDIGVARPSAQGQAMMTHRHRGDQRVGEARAPGPRAPSRRRPGPPRPARPARTSRRPCRPCAGSVRGCAGPRPPWRRCGPAWCRRRLFRRA